MKPKQDPLFKMPEAKAPLPVEDDVRAARFWLQVNEEAREAAVSVDWIMHRRYGTRAHEQYFKRGATILTRFDLVMSPEFDAADTERAKGFEEIYRNLVSGPLVKLKKNGGKRGKFIGLVLRSVPKADVRQLRRGTRKRQMNSDELKTVRAIWEMNKDKDSHEVRLTESFLNKNAETQMNSPALPNVLGHGGFDLNVDHNGYSRRIAGEVATSEGFPLVGGVNYFRMHEFYLTVGGKGRILYFRGDPDDT